MRKLANTVALENLFTAVPGKNAPGYPAGSGSMLLKAFSEKVFRPNVPVVKDDCGTKLGRLIYSDTDLIGKVLLNDVMGGAGNNTVVCPAGKLVTSEDLTKIISEGIPQVRIRTLDSCVASSSGVQGVCGKCLHASAEYTFKVTVPSLSTSTSFVAFGTNSPNQPTPRYWMLEDVVNDTRNTYVVYYNDESVVGTNGLPKVRKPNGITPASLPTNLVTNEGVIAYVQVAVLVTDSLETILRKTAEALDKTGQFSCSVVNNELFIRDIFYSPVLTTHVPYSPTSNAIDGISFKGLSKDSKARLDQHTMEGFYDRFSESSSGSILGVKKATDFPLPFREELFYATVSDNDVAIAYRELNKVLGKKVPLDMLRYIDELPDRLEKSLLIIAVYTIYSFLRV
jgi:hypothetical protein